MSNINDDMAALGLPDFETENYCTKQNAAMLKRLSVYAPEDYRYFTQLLDSNDPTDQRDGDWTASRTARWKLITQATAIFKGRNDLLFVTYGHPSWRIPCGNLSSFNMLAVRQCVYRRLNQLGPYVLAAGAFEFRLSATYRVWDGHVHLTVAGASPSELRRVFKIGRGVRHPHEKPLHIDHIGDLPSRLGYSTKRIVKQSVSYKDKCGLPRQRKLPLKPRDQVEYDLWLLNLKAGSRQIFHGLRMHGDRLHRLHLDE